MSPPDASDLVLAALTLGLGFLLGAVIGFGLRDHLASRIGALFPYSGDSHR